jgi:hypothetical protein
MEADMLRPGYIATVLGLLFLACISSTVLAQGGTPFSTDEADRLHTAQDRRPPLFFRETWKPPTAAPGQSCQECNQATQKLVTQEFVDNPNLEVKLYGPGAKQLIVTQRTRPKDDPTFIWSGLVTANWLVMLRHKTNNVDLSSMVSKIKWRTHMIGFNLLRPVIRLADGTFLVADKFEPESTDWRDTEFQIADIRWRILEPDTVTLAPGSPWKERPDLTQVEEIGFTDMMRSRRYSGGLTRIDYLEVYGNPVPRPAAQKKD